MKLASPCGFLVAGAVLLGGATAALAVSVGEKSGDPSPESQLASFTIHEDFTVNLFADESLGIANPVAMHWDDEGRLWVLTTLTYAQLEPGEKPDDTLVILEDTDGDGRADESTVFADGLEMPMGFALGDEGVYLGEGPDLLLLRDTDGDDRADTREVILTGFGTGDTHQNISNFTWGPEGCLWFAQGLHCFSRVETPWGIVRGDEAGFWRFDPRTLRLDPFCFPSLASQNPCGIAFDRSGAMFLKSNNRELIYVTPGLIPTKNPNSLVPVASIGATPGKSMAGEFVDSAHLPAWLQGNVLIAGYYANRVSAFPLVEEGAGYARVEPVELLHAGHTSFRPVEVRIGPDGAIYIADWFNPIIGHYQASLRHPDRDESHGRIWRMTAKERELLDRDAWQGPGPTTLERPDVTVESIRGLANSERPRDRLDAIVRGAQVRAPDSAAVERPAVFAALLEVLDHPRDRFIDYALVQAVHAMADAWLPATRSHGLTFSRPDHLAFALETLGGPEAMEIAGEMLASDGLSPEARHTFALVVAREGGPGDLLALLRSDGEDPAILRAMAESFRRRKVVPEEGFTPVLAAGIGSDDAEVSALALRLAGLWGASDLADRAREILLSTDRPSGPRGEAAIALARWQPGSAVPLLVETWTESPAELRPSLMEAFVMAGPRKAVETATAFFSEAATVDEVAPVLAVFLPRKGATELLRKELATAGIGPEPAGYLAGAMSRLGRNDEALLGVLHDAMGITAGARAYSPAFVAKLAGEIIESGNADAGRAIYQRAELTCIACHQLDDVGGVIGPSLDAVGAGLPVDLLIESVLWPNRQMKEGYLATSVSTKSGEIYSGYREKEQDGVFYLRDTVSGEVKAIPRVEISRIENAGSLMPAGLTNGLSREELRDLVAFLASLKG